MGGRLPDAQPLLLDELLDARVLLAEPDWDAWRAELDRRARGASRRRRAADGRAAPLPARADVPPARAGPRGPADGRAARRPPVGARRHDPRRDARALLAADCASARRRRRASRSSATASSAARSSATRPTSTSSSCTSDDDDARWRRRALRAPRAAHQHVAHQRDGRGTAVRDRPAAAPRRRRGPARVERRRVRALPARAGVDVGAPGADARALRRRRREHRRGVRSRRATQCCACRAIRRSSRPTSSTCARRWRRASRTARRCSTSSTTGRHGRHRVRRAVPRARARARARRSSRATPATSRCCASRPTQASSRRRWRSTSADAYREYRRLQHQVRLTGAPHARVDPAPQRHDARVERCGRVSGAAARERCVPSAKIARFGKRGMTPPCRWPTATAGSGTTASWCRGATPRPTCSRTRCTTAWACSRACALQDRPQGPAIFRLHEHTERLFNSAQIFGMKIPFTRERADRGAARVVRDNKLESCYLRPLAFYGSETMGVAAKSNPVHVAIAAWPWGAYLGAEASRRASASRPRRYTRHHPNITMCGRRPWQLHQLDPRQPGSDARRLRRGAAARPDGFVCRRRRRERLHRQETASSTRPTSPAARSTGITRDTIIALAGELGIPGQSSGASRATRSTSPTRPSSPAPRPR